MRVRGKLRQMGRHAKASAPLVFALALTLVTFVSCLASGASAERWRPAPTTEPWQWQLQGQIDTSVDAPVYELDGFDTPARVVRRLHRQGRKAICYISAGSWEEWRPDADRFPGRALGRVYDGYPDERWLDIRRIRALAPVLRARIAMCARKGFDAVEPDNINGWENRTGFPLSGADQLRFNRWLARQVHRAGLSVALKNDGPQAKRLVRHFDFAVVESCFTYDECGPYRAFIRAGKAVFATEYEIGPAKFCAKARRLRFSAIKKSYDLYARPWRPCGRRAGFPGA